jgi:hypothetical protein
MFILCYLAYLAYLAYLTYLAYLKKFMNIFRVGLGDPGVRVRDPLGA